MEYEPTAPIATIVGVGIALVSAVLVALLSAFVARIFVGRDRRRQMYGEAFRVALEWREMVYRVRRRDNSKEHDRALIDRFHDLQERLDYYEGWIGHIGGCLSDRARFVEVPLVPGVCQDAQKQVEKWEMRRDA